MQNKAKGNIALLTAAFIWGSGFLAQKLGMAYIGPFTFNGTRQLIAALVLLPYGIILTRRSGFFAVKAGSPGSSERAADRKRALARASLVCGFFLAMGTNLQQIGLMTVSAGKSGFITSIYIVFVPIIGILLGERVSGRIWACVGVALLGFALLSLRGGDMAVSGGDLITLAGSAAFACQIIAVNRFVTRNNAILLSIGQTLVSGALSILIAVMTERPGVLALSMSAKPILYSALIPTAIGFTLQVVGQRYTDPSLAALILSLEAVFAALLGMIVLQERMSLREVLGCVLILIATVTASLPDKNYNG